MNLDQAIADYRRAVLDCVAAAVVDVRRGTLLSVKAASIHRPALETAAAAAQDLLCRPTESAAEALFGMDGESDTAPCDFQETVVISDNLVHVIQRCRNDDGLALVAVCRNTMNLGMVLARARAGLARFELAA